MALASLGLITAPLALSPVDSWAQTLRSMTPNQTITIQNERVVIDAPVVILGHMGAEALVEAAITTTLQSATIAASTPAVLLAADDVRLLNSMSTTNGTIIGVGRALNVGSTVSGMTITGVEIWNAGIIQTSGDAVNGAIYVDGSADGVTLTNAANGVVGVASGNRGDAVSIQLGRTGDQQRSATITNLGVLAGSGAPSNSGPNSASAGLRLFNGAGAHQAIFTGTIYNAASGTISSDGGAPVNSIATVDRASAVLIAEVDFWGRFENDGLIEGTRNGVYFKGDGDATGGEFVNRGTIQSASRAVYLTNDNLNFINSGTILGTSNQRNGVIYVNGSSDHVTLTNTASGVIGVTPGHRGDAVSIQLGEPGDRQRSATITNAGILAGSGAPSNSGPNSASAGLRLFNGAGAHQAIFTGTIYNAASGTISSDGGAPADSTATVDRASAVLIAEVDFQGRFENDGLIEGTRNGVYFKGDGDATGGEFVNRGTIQSASRAVYLTNDNLNLINSGTILGTGDQRNGVIYVNGSSNNVTLTNTASGAIGVAPGHRGDAVSIQLGEQGDRQRSATITNAGILAGSGAPSNSAPNSAGAGLRLFNGAGDDRAIFTGTIYNAATGMILSDGGAPVDSTATIDRASAVLIAELDFQGRFENDGLIEGARNGVYFKGDGDATGGVFVNRGTIQSASRAVYLTNDNLSFTNSGAILGTGDQRNGVIYVNGSSNNFTLINTASGRIGVTPGYRGDAVSIQLGQSGDRQRSATITNAGILAGLGAPSNSAPNSAGAGLRLFNGAGDERAIFTGTIYNAATGMITSDGGAPADSTATIDRASAVLIAELDFQGRFENDGLIEGARNGVYFKGDGDATGGVFVNRGTIQSASRAVYLTNDNLSFTNSGTILGTGDQRNGVIYVNGSSNNLTLTNTANGMIGVASGMRGDAVSIQLGQPGDRQRSATITNAGVLAGLGAPSNSAPNSAGAGLRLFNGAGDDRVIFTGTIYNAATGMITSDGGAPADSTATIDRASAVLIAELDFQGRFENDGLIEGARNGVYFKGDGDATGGIFVNRGTIQSASRAVYLTNDNLSFTNSGMIIGTGDQRNGVVYVNGTSDNITLTNTASGTITSASGITASAVSIQLGQADSPSRTFIITNAGLIQGRGNSETNSIGLRLFNGADNPMTTVTEMASFSGLILNTGTIDARNGVDDDVAAIRGENIRFTDSARFINRGDILADSPAIDFRTVQNANFRHESGTIMGDVLFGTSPDIFTFAGGIFVNSTVDTGAGPDRVIFELSAATLDFTADYIFDGDIIAVEISDSLLTSLAAAGASVLLSGTNRGAMLSSTATLQSGIFVASALSANEATINLSPRTDADLADDLMRQDSSAANLLRAVNTELANLPVTSPLLQLNQARTPAAAAALAQQFLPARHEGVSRLIDDTQRRLFSRLSQSHLDRIHQTPRGRVWVDGFGFVAAQNRKNGISGYDSFVAGTALGAEMNLLTDRFKLGAMFNYAYIDIDDNSPQNEQIDLNLYQFSLYSDISFAQGGFVRGLISGGFFDTEIDRNRPNAAGSSQRIGARGDGALLSVQGGAGFSIPAGPLTIIPEANLQYSYIDQYRYHDGVFAINPDIVESLDLGLAIRLSGNFGDRLGGLRPTLGFGWSYDILRDPRSHQLALGGQSFTVEGARPNRSRYALNAGFDYHFSPIFKGFISYEGEYTTSYDSHGGRLGLSIGF